MKDWAFFGVLRLSWDLKEVGYSWQTEEVRKWFQLGCILEARNPLGWE